MKYATYIPSRLYDERADVPRDEDPETLQDESSILYWDYENKHSGANYGGIDMKKYERVIETKAPIKFVKDDVIKIGDISFKIDEVQIIIPKERQKAVDMWPNMEIIHSIKRLFLK